MNELFLVIVMFVSCTFAAWAEKSAPQFPTQTNAFSAIRTAAWSAVLFLLAICAPAIAKAPDMHGGIDLSQETSVPSLHWSWVNPQPSGDRFYAVAYGGGVYVGVGSGGAIYSSPDGKQWTARSGGLGQDGYYTSIVYGNGQFLAIGFDSANVTHLAMSSDGTAWTDQITNQPLVGRLLYGNGTYLVANLGNVSDQVFTSTDGYTWAQQSVGPATFLIESAAFADGKFAVLGAVNSTGSTGSTGSTAFGIYYSQDGVTWTQSHFTMTVNSTSPIRNFVGIAGGTPGFVLTGNVDIFRCAIDCGVIFTSQDAVTWTQQPNITAFFLNDNVIWDGSRFLASALNGLYTSTDGNNWQLLSSSQVDVGPNSVATAGPGQYVIVPPSVQPLELWESTDFVNWTASDFTTGPTPLIVSAGFQGGKYFASTLLVNSAVVSILESDDGLNWSQVFSETVVGLGDGITAVTYGNGTYLALDSSGNVLRSTDGTHWGTTATPPADHMTQLTFGNGTFIASGISCNCASRIYTSPDGMTWTAQDLSALNWNAQDSIVFTGSRFISLSPQSVTATSTGNFTVYTSTDGVNWSSTGASFPANITISNLAVSGGVVVATGVGSSVADNPIYYVLWSQDGLSWSSSMVNSQGGFTGSLQTNLLVGSEYYVPIYRTVYTSADGQNWMPALGSPSVQAFALFAQGTRVYASGAFGSIMVTELGGPAAAAGAQTTNQGMAVSGTLAVTGSATGPLTYSLAAVPAHGSVTIDDATTGAYTYTPASGFSGSDRFAFTVTDGVARTTAAESVTINAPSSPGGGSGGSSGGGGIWIFTDLLFLAFAIARRLHCGHLV